MSHTPTGSSANHKLPDNGEDQSFCGLRHRRRTEQASVAFIKSKRVSGTNILWSSEGSPLPRMILSFLCPSFMLTPNGPTNGASGSKTGEVGRVTLWSILEADLHLTVLFEPTLPG